MKPMFAGFVAVVVISLVAWYGLDQMGLTSEAVNSGSNVRLD